MQHVHDAVHHFLKETHTPPVGFGRNRTKVYGGLGFDEGGGELGFDEDDLLFAEEQLTPALKRVPWRLWLEMRTDQRLGSRARTEFTHGSLCYRSCPSGKSRTVSSTDLLRSCHQAAARISMMYPALKGFQGSSRVWDATFSLVEGSQARVDSSEWFVSLTQGLGRVRVKLFPLTE